MDKDITYIASYPKSGATWLRFMLFHALFDAPDDKERAITDYIYTTALLDRVPTNSDVPRYLHTHLPFSERLPLLSRTARAVYLVRDPIDVMLSVWDFRHLISGGEAWQDHDREWTAFSQTWIKTGGEAGRFNGVGSWSGNVLSWLDQSSLPLLVVSYEAMKADPAGQLTRILNFIKRPQSAARAKMAVEASSVENLRKQEEKEITSRVMGAFFKPEAEPAYAKGYRFVGRLHENSREKWLTPEQRITAEKMFGPTLALALEKAVAP